MMLHLKMVRCLRLLTTELLYMGIEHFGTAVSARRHIGAGHLGAWISWRRGYNNNKLIQF